MTPCEQLCEIIKTGRRLVIFLHDKPDPDAIAAGWLLAHIATSLGIRYRIVYGGRVARAENRAMIQLLKIPLHALDNDAKPMRFLKSDRYALLDTQPGVGNNSFPIGRLPCHIVIDHHPRRPDLQADFADIRPDQGGCTTMVLSYFRERGLVPTPNLATAAAYAIISETQDLEREATRHDRQALQLLFPQVRLTILGRIRHPARRRTYYQTIARAMQHVEVSKNSCVCHIGPVSDPEVVAEVADFLVAMERVTWCLVTGLYDGIIIVSIRTTHRRANAERVMKRILRHQGKGGGHGMIAGGSMPCEDEKKYPIKVALLKERFVKQLSRRHPVLFRPLIT